MIGRNKPRNALLLFNAALGMSNVNGGIGGPMEATRINIFRANTEWAMTRAL